MSVAGTATASTDFSNFRLYVGGTSVAGGTLSGTTLAFSNLTIPLAQDAWVDLTVEADVNSGSSGTVWLVLTPSSVTSTVVVTDSNYGTPTIETGARTTNVITLTQNSVTVTNNAAALGSAIVQSQNTVGYNATYAFTLTNNSNNDLYVSATPGTFVTTTITSTGTTTGTALTSVTLSPSTVSGDDQNGAYYAIPAGTARSFTFAAAIYGASGHSVNLKATTIHYSTSTTLSPDSTIATGLSTLSLTASF